MGVILNLVECVRSTPRNYYILLVTILRDDFPWTLTSITVAYFLRSMISALLSPVVEDIADFFYERGLKSTVRNWNQQYIFVLSGKFSL